MTRLLRGCLVLVALALTVRLGVLFVGVFAFQGFGMALSLVTDPFSLPIAGLFGFDNLITSPYGGVIDADAGLTLVMISVVMQATVALRPGDDPAMEEEL